MNIELKNWTIRSAPQIVPTWGKLSGMGDLSGWSVGEHDVKQITLVGPNTVRIVQIVSNEPVEFVVSADGAGEVAPAQAQQQVKR